MAERYGYSRPQVNEGNGMEMVEGRHPVLERISLDERFVPNDLSLNGEDRQILIITGPNMAGKSTIMRQTALIVIMAQMGSFVPAKEATLSAWWTGSSPGSEPRTTWPAGGAPSWWRWRKWPTS